MFVYVLDTIMQHRKVTKKLICIQTKLKVVKLKCDLGAFHAIRPINISGVFYTSI